MDLHFNESNFESYVMLVLLVLKERNLNVYRYSSKSGSEIPLIRYINRNYWNPTLLFEGLVVPGAQPIMTYLDQRYPSPFILPIDPSEYVRSISSYISLVDLINSLISKYEVSEGSVPVEFYQELSDFVLENSKVLKVLLETKTVLVKATLMSLVLFFVTNRLEVQKLVSCMMSLGGVTEYLRSAALLTAADRLKQAQVINLQTAE